MNKTLEEFEKKINIKFKDINLLKQSLTHKSHSTENNYEKLEFLGDRVLGLVISKKLLELYPNEKVGVLDKKFAALVNKNICFDVGIKLKLNHYMTVGNTKKNLITAQKKLISDCMESLIGAIYLDRGFDQSKKFILTNWQPHINLSKKLIIDAKTRLQEYSLKKFKILPIYKNISNSGPKHSPEFIVAVKLKNTKFVEGSGSSKKNAEQSAAENYINKYIDDLAR